MNARIFRRRRGPTGQPSNVPKPTPATSTLPTSNIESRTSKASHSSPATRHFPKSDDLTHVDSYSYAKHRGATPSEYNGTSPSDSFCHFKNSSAAFSDGCALFLQNMGDGGILPLLFRPACPGPQFFTTSLAPFYPSTFRTLVPSTQTHARKIPPLHSFSTMLAITTTEKQPARNHYASTVSHVLNAP